MAWKTGVRIRLRNFKDYKPDADIHTANGILLFFGLEFVSVQIDGNQYNVKKSDVRILAQPTE